MTGKNMAVEEKNMGLEKNVKILTGMALSLLITVGIIFLAQAQDVDPADIAALRQQLQDAGDDLGDSDILDVADDAKDLDEDRRTSRLAASAVAKSTSALEIDYRIRSDIESLSQYGYGLFQNIATDTVTETGRVPERYILGIGDRLVITLVGSTDRSFTLRVDREGRIILPDIGPLPASGRSFGDIRREIEDQVYAAMLGTEVYVSLGTIRQISVLVLGEVSLPGLHNMTSLSTILQALASAGGVKKTGSLRNIHVENGDEIIKIDIYKLMRFGTGADLQMIDGMKIIVPQIGDTVAIAGEVQRAAIYEIAVDEVFSGAELLELAGGPLRPRGNSYFLNRIREDGRQTLDALENLDLQIGVSDILTVGFLKDLIVDIVTLEGHVRVQGERPLSAARTVSALVGGFDGLGPEPYLPFAILETTDPVTRARILVPVNLERVMQGAEDINLRDRDAVFVFSRLEIDFLSQPALRNTIIRGEAPQDACPSLVALEDFLSDKEIDRFSAVVRSVFVRDPSEGEIRVQEAGGIATEDTRLRAEASESIEGVATLDEDLPNPVPAQLICTSLFDLRPDMLRFTLEHAVSVIGAIRNPGVYPVASSVTLDSIVSVGGGFSNNADPTNIEVTSLSSVTIGGVANSETRFINAITASMAEIDIIAGATIRFNALITNQESGTVLLTGEFERPGVYSITRGETMGQLIDRAGGLTEYAYPYGAVMTRESIKREQRQGFRRAAREINNALAVAAVRADLAADTIIAAQNLANQLQLAEAAGRMIVETDPAVLRTKPREDIIMSPGDHITMPKRPVTVIISGDVLNPGAMKFVPGKTVSDYIAEAGGFSQSADDDRVFLVYPNGIAAPVNLSSWFLSSNKLRVPPGSAIIVPKNLNPVTTLELVSEISTILGQFALSAASIAVITR